MLWTAVVTEYSTDGSGSKRSPETIFLPPVATVVKENTVVLPLFAGMLSCSHIREAIREATSGSAPRSISQVRSVRCRFWVSQHLCEFLIACFDDLLIHILRCQTIAAERTFISDQSSFAISSKQTGQTISLNLLLFSDG